MGKRTMSAAFGTLSTARHFEAAGFERTQTEAIASAIVRSDERAVAKAELVPLATQADLSDLKTELRSGIPALNKRLSTDTAALATGGRHHNVQRLDTRRAVAATGLVRSERPAPRYALQWVDGQRPPLRDAPSALDGPRSPPREQGAPSRSPGLGAAAGLLRRAAPQVRALCCADSAGLPPS